MSPFLLLLALLVPADAPVSAPGLAAPATLARVPGRPEEPGRHEARRIAGSGAVVALPTDPVPAPRDGSGLRSGLADAFRPGTSPPGPTLAPPVGRTALEIQALVRARPVRAP